MDEGGWVLGAEEKEYRLGWASLRDSGSGPSGSTRQTHEASGGGGVCLRNPVLDVLFAFVLNFLTAQGAK